MSGENSVLQYYSRDTGNSALLCEKFSVRFQRIWSNKTYQGDVFELEAPDLQVTSMQVTSRVVVTSYVAEALNPS